MVGETIRRRRNWSALDSASDKAPGAGGFFVSFFLGGAEGRHQKHLIVFHSQQVFERSFSAPFVALIPKKVGVSELRDFRRISHITGM